MSNGKGLQPTKYGAKKYNLKSTVDFDVAVKYGTVLMAIAGADGELAEPELQWYIDEQELLAENSQEYIDTLRTLDWKKASIQDLLNEIKYDFPINSRRVMLYHAIKMSRADGNYHEQEKAAVAKAAEILEIERSIVVSLESLAEMEEASDRLRLALFETEV
ncbi:MAG: hypothetical protein F6J93_08030 [Oscillatoria sp. SIO1A7]|nr:hypothetical protein [Oscillatoria sp. SIO1A7]